MTSELDPGVSSVVTEINYTCDTVTQNGNTTHLPLSGMFNGVLSTLIVNSVVCVALLIIFYFLHWRNWTDGGGSSSSRRQINFAKSSTHERQPLLASANTVESQPHDEDERVTHRQGPSMIARLKTLWYLTEDDLKVQCGNDAILYRSFQRHLLACMSIITLLSVAILLPVNEQGRLLNKDDTFGRTTIANLEPEDDIMALHTFVSLIYLIMLLAAMFRFRLNVGDRIQTTRTLLLRHIPFGSCDVNTIQQHLQETYPGIEVKDIQLTYDVKELDTIDENLRRAIKYKAYYEEKYESSATGTRPIIRPSVCDQVISCCSADEVDAVTFYRDEVARLTIKYEHERRKALQLPLDMCFVTLGSEAQVERVLSDTSQSKSSIGLATPWAVSSAPPSATINWENLSYPRKKWRQRAVLINCCIFTVFFFLTTPTMVLQVLDKVDFDIKKPLEHLHSATLVEFTPPLLLWALSLALPKIVSGSEHFMRHWFKSAEHHAVLIKTFTYLCLMVLILPTLGLTSAETLIEYFIVGDSNSIKWECVFLPGNGSFFVNFIINTALIGGFVQILMPELMLYWYTRAGTRSRLDREEAEKKVLTEFEYGKEYAYMLCNFAIVISFSVSCPIITLFGFLYILVKYAVDRYNTVYVYRPSHVSRDMHVTATVFVLVAAIFLQCNLLLFRTIKGDYTGTGFFLPCIILILAITGYLLWSCHAFIPCLANIKITLTFGDLSRRLRSLCCLHLADDTDEDLEDRTSTEPYIAPVLQAEMPTTTQPQLDTSNEGSKTTVPASEEVEEQHVQALQENC